MRRRLPAVFFAALLTFAVSGCGDDSDDSGEPTNDESTSQTDDSTDDSTDGTNDGAEPTETDDTTGGTENDDTDDHGGDSSDKDDDGKSDDKSDDGDDNGAIPDDLETGDPDDPDDLPISAQVVLDTCEDVDPKDTWPAAGEVTFDGEGRSVVATADVAMKGGKTLTIVGAIAGSEKNPQVKAYNPI